MKTMILCGGLGTRMREETEFRPKPLVDIGGRPILWHILKLYSHYGFADFVLCLGYRGSMIKDYFLQYEAKSNDFTIELGNTSTITYHQKHAEQGLKITCADTGPTTMTGGRILQASKYIDNDTFLLTYGDGVSNVDLEKLVEFHHSHGKLATVTAVRPQSRFGMIDFDDDQRVSQFAEKPLSSGWASAGFFVLHRKVFDYLNGPECIFEREPLERLAKEGQLKAFRHEGFFYAMDTYREYQYLNELWNSGNAPWKVW